MFEVAAVFITLIMVTIPMLKRPECTHHVLFLCTSATSIEQQKNKNKKEEEKRNKKENLLRKTKLLINNPLQKMGVTAFPSEMYSFTLKVCKTLQYLQACILIEPASLKF